MQEEEKQDKGSEVGRGWGGAGKEGRVGEGETNAVFKCLGSLEGVEGGEVEGDGKGGVGAGRGQVRG